MRSHVRRQRGVPMRWASIDPPIDAPPIGELIGAAPYVAERCVLHTCTCPACGRFIEQGHCWWRPAVPTVHVPWLCYECGLGINVHLGFLPDEALGCLDPYASGPAAYVEAG